MSVPVAPRRWPVLGHTPALLRRRFGFTAGLRTHGEVVRAHLGTLPMYFVTTPELTHRVLVADSASFGKGAMFDKFRPFVGNGLVNSGGAFHLRQRRLVQPAFHRERITRYAEEMEIAVSRLSGSWRHGVPRRPLVGSAISIIEAAGYRDVDGVLVTDMSHHLNVLGLAPIAATFVPAALDPAFAGRTIDLGYLTTMPGTRWRSLHSPGPYDAAIDSLVDAALLGTVTPYTRQVGVPVLTVMAGADPTFYGPAARPQAYVLPGYGHALNYAPNAPELHDVVVRWAARMIRR